MDMAATGRAARRDRRSLLALLAGGAAAPFAVIAQDSSHTPRLDVPYVPTPQEVVDAMLKLARVSAKDTVYDLGCGDGRIVITAAKRHRANGIGIDLNPQRIAEAEDNARQAGVAERVKFRVANLFDTDVSPASVVTLYLLPDINQRLRPQLWKQLKVGTRIVSHAFDMGTAWPPERTVDVEGKTIYGWTIRERHKRARG
jgi:SAM-dependent methyltransferase